MNRKQLASALARKTGMPKCDVDVVIGAMVAEFQEQLARGESIKLQGLGTMEVRPRAPRMGRNISNGSKISVPARLVPVFKPSSVLKELVDKA